MRRLGRFALAIGACLLIGGPIAAADEPGWSYQLAHDVMSPFCPGLTLTECPSPDAAALRKWIIEQEQAGVSQQAVEALLFERYGDQLLQAPRAEGLGLVAYAIPAGGALLGAVVVAGVIRRKRSAGSASEAAPGDRPVRSAQILSSSDGDLEREIDAEIGA